jgi:hypothetical protein
MRKSSSKKKGERADKEVGPPMFWNLISINCESLGAERGEETRAPLFTGDKGNPLSTQLAEVIKLQS